MDAIARALQVAPDYLKKVASLAGQGLADGKVLAAMLGGARHELKGMGFRAKVRVATFWGRQWIGV